MRPVLAAACGHFLVMGLLEGSIDKCCGCPLGMAHPQCGGCLNKLSGEEHQYRSCAGSRISDGLRFAFGGGKGIAR